MFFSIEVKLLADQETMFVFEEELFAVKVNKMVILLVRPRIMTTSFVQLKGGEEPSRKVFLKQRMNRD